MAKQLGLPEQYLSQPAGFAYGQTLAAGLSMGFPEHDDGRLCAGALENEWRANLAWKKQWLKRFSNFLIFLILGGVAKPEKDSLDLQKAVSYGVEGILALPSLISRIIAGYDIELGCYW